MKTFSEKFLALSRLLCRRILNSPEKKKQRKTSSLENFHREINFTLKRVVIESYRISFRLLYISVWLFDKAIIPNKKYKYRARWRLERKAIERKGIGSFGIKDNEKISIGFRWNVHVHIGISPLHPVKLLEFKLFNNSTRNAVPFRLYVHISRSSLLCTQSSIDDGKYSCHGLQRRLYVISPPL